MRYLYKEQSGNHKTLLTFALGHQEALIIYALLGKAKKYMPKTFETQFDQARINAMYNTLQPLMKELRKLDYTENEAKVVEQGEEHA